MLLTKRYDGQYLFDEFENPLTVREYALMKKLSEARVRRLIHAGKIRAQQFYIVAGDHPKYGYNRYLIDGLSDSS